MANSGMVAITVALIGAGATVATAYIANQGKDEKAPAPLATVPPAQQPAPQTVQQPAAPTAAPAPLSDGATRALEAVAAASSAPATTPPPPASNPGNQFDVAGQWHTPDHSPVVATQEGGTFAIATVPVGIGAYGTGRIMGNQLAWDYVSVPSQTTGRCTGSIAPDGQTIASTCYDSSGASYPYELHRPGAR
jgi:hypothetical protein